MNSLKCIVKLSYFQYLDIALIDTQWQTYAFIKKRWKKYDKTSRCNFKLHCKKTIKME